MYMLKIHFILTYFVFQKWVSVCLDKGGVYPKIHKRWHVDSQDWYPFYSPFSYIC